MIRAIVAVVVVESQFSRNGRCSVFAIELNTWVKINCHTKPTRMPPIKFGMKKILLRIFLPRIFCVTSIPSPNARAFTITTHSAVNIRVYRKDLPNSSPSVNIVI